MIMTIKTDRNTQHDHNLTKKGSKERLMLAPWCRFLLLLLLILCFFSGLLYLILLGTIMNKHNETINNRNASMTPMKIPIIDLAKFNNTNDNNNSIARTNGDGISAENNRRNGKNIEIYESDDEEEGLLSDSERGEVMKSSLGGGGNGSSIGGGIGGASGNASGIGGGEGEEEHSMHVDDNIEDDYENDGGGNKERSEKSPRFPQSGKNDGKRKKTNEESNGHNHPPNRGDIGVGKKQRKNSPATTSPSPKTTSTPSMKSEKTNSPFPPPPVPPPPVPPKCLNCSYLQKSMRNLLKTIDGFLTM